MKLIKICKLLTFFILLSTNFLSQNHSFSYQSPQCINAGNIAPVTSTNFAPNGSFSSQTGLSLNASSGIINLNTSTAGSYTVTYSCTCFTNPAVFATLIINPLPVVIITGSNQICSGSAITLTASGAATYTWSTGAQTSVLTDTPSLNTTYTVYATSIDGCENFAIKSVTVNPVPNVNIVANNTLCTGYAYALQATGANSYIWSTGATAPSISVTPVSPLTTYSVIGATNGCTNSAIHSVSLIPIPTVAIAPSTNTVCFGSSLTLTASGAVNYSWSTGNVDDTLHVSPLTSTGYTVMGTDINGCSSNSVKYLTVIARPSITTIGTNKLCTGKSLTLTALGGDTYTWSTGLVAQTVTLIPLNDTVYTVSGSKNGCVGTASVFIDVEPSPTLSVNNPTMCSGNTATIETIALPSDQTINYQWYPGGSAPGTLVVSPPSTKSYTIIATLGTCTAAAISQVQVIQTILPPVNFTYNGPYCTGNVIANPNKVANFMNGGSFTSLSTMPLNESTGAVDLNNITPGFYVINYSVSASGCTLSNVGSAGFLVNKSIQISAENYLEVLPGNSVPLLNSGGADSYIWNPSTWLDCSTCPTPVSTPLSTIKYCVSSEQPCVIGTCIEVEVLCINNGDLSVPNAFTPNRDGNNDKFCLQGWNDCNQAFNISVFDRWGGVVFESNNPNFCWDGTSSGQLLASGVYVYIINARFGKEPAFKKSGNITLIR